MHNVPKWLRKLFNTAKPTKIETDDLYKTYEGEVTTLVESKGVQHYMMQWHTVKEVSGAYEIEDDDQPETIEMMGGEVTREEWEVLLKDNLCTNCNQPLEFVSGHVAIDEDAYVCADCVEEDLESLTQAHAGNCAC